MSDGATTLAYSGYFLGCLRPCLTKAKDAKVTESDSATGSIDITSAGGTSIWGVSAWVASTGGNCMGVRLSGIDSWLSIK